MEENNNIIEAGKEEDNNSFISSLRLSLNKSIYEYSHESLQMVQRITMPDETYVRKLANRYGLRFGLKIPIIWKDIYSLFKGLEQNPEDFNVDDFIYNESEILDFMGVTELTEDLKSVYNNNYKFFKSIDFTQISGFSALDKTFNLLSFVVYIQDKGKQNGTEDVDILSDAEEKLVDDKTLQESLGKEAWLDNEHEPNVSISEFNDTLGKTIESNIRMALYDLSPVIKHIIQGKEEKSIPINSALLKLIKVKMSLDSKLGDVLGSSTDKELNNNTNKREQVRLSTISQASNASIIQMALPKFNEKVIEKDIHVKTKIAPKKSKQSVIIAVDDSGSMCYLHKQSYVRGIILKLLEEVIKGDMELTFYSYESSLYNKTVVKTEEECKQLFNFINKRRPNGGGTKIGENIQSLIDEVVINPDLVNPEIFIVCDGEDHVDPDTIDFKGVKVNFISLGNYRKTHERLATLSGGSYILEEFNSKEDYGKTRMYGL